MDYNEIRRTWDSQKEEPLFSINEAALREQVTSEARCYGEMLRMLQWAAILVLYFLSGQALVAAAMHGGSQFHAISFVITTVAGTYHVRKLWLRRRYELSFDDSLEGVVRKSISRIDYLISLLKALVWWFALPMFVIAALKYSFGSASKGLVGAAALLVVFGIAFFASRRELRSKHLPQRKNFQTLLEKLRAAPE